MRPRVRLIFILPLLFSLLAGCADDDSAEAMFDRYGGRLANALDLQIETRVGSTQRYPRRRDLQLPLASASINLLDFLRLSDCDLQRLLGERNSSLGKFMPASQQLIYHRRLLQLGDQCLDLLAADEDRRALRQKLQTVLQAKRGDSQRIAWNASAASEEFQRLFSLADGALSRREAATPPGELIHALQRLRPLLVSDQPVDGAAFEGLYQVLGSGNRAGRLLQSQRLATDRLNALTTAMRDRLHERALCFRPNPTPDAKVARKVLMRFYAGEVQPYLSGVHRQSRDLQAALSDLLGPWQPWPQAFEDYWQRVWSPDHPDSGWRRFEQAIADHTHLWQTLLQQCGMSPGGQGYQPQDAAAVGADVDRSVAGLRQ